MILKSFKNFFSLLIIFLFILPLKGEEKIDIWKNNKKNNTEEKLKENSNNSAIQKEKIFEINQKKT